MKQDSSARRGNILVSFHDMCFSNDIVGNYYVDGGRKYEGMEA